MTRRLVPCQPRARVRVADNADDSPDDLAQVCAPQSGYMSTPFGDDVELSMRLN